MSELLVTIFADLEFSESDEIEIEDIILFFVFAERSQKFYDTIEIVCSSGYLQDFVVETLDTETISQSRYSIIFFIQILDEIQHLFFGIGIQFDAQFR